jgi:mRNA interferase MazF
MNRGDVRLVRLDPTLGREIGKTRPCVIVSPDELNLHLRTVIVAPMIRTS